MESLHLRKLNLIKTAVGLPANKNYKPIKVTSENEFIVWGVVTYAIKSY